MLRSCAVLSRCCVGSRVISSAQPSYQLIPVRGLRTRNPNDEPKDKEHSEKPDSEFKKEETEQKTKHGLPPNAKIVVINTAVYRRMFVIGAISFGIATIATFLMLKIGFVKTQQAVGEEIDFDLFVEKFLKAGEVRSISYFPQNKLALAELHPGAVIDGKPFDKPAVAVRYDRASSGLPDQFQAEIRRIEEKLQIGPQDAIRISVIQGASGIKMFEFVLGSAIILFLLMAYMRVAARKLAQTNAKTPFQKGK